jgi:hypothetical protein
MFLDQLDGTNKEHVLSSTNDTYQQVLNTFDVMERKMRQVWYGLLTSGDI